MLAHLIGCQKFLWLPRKLKRNVQSVVVGEENFFCEFWQFIQVHLFM
jgi:hypothetical protein